VESERKGVAALATKVATARATLDATRAAEERARVEAEERAKVPPPIVPVPAEPAPAGPLFGARSTPTPAPAGPAPVETTRTFTRDELLDLDLPNPGKSDRVEVVSDEITGTRRWSVDHWLVFRLPGQPEGFAWGVSYSVGATESQDESPWQYEDTVEAVLLQRVERVVAVWEAVEAAKDGAA
jgi:hypothetical protein